MRCGSSLRVTSSIVASAAVAVAASLSSHRLVSVGNDGTVTMPCSASDVRTMLLRLQREHVQRQRERQRQRRQGRRQGFSARDGTVATERKEVDEVQSHEALSLMQLIACSEVMCHPENPLAQSARDERSNAVLLLLRALARSKRALADPETPVQGGVVHPHPWTAALRLFLQSPLLEGKPRDVEHGLCVQQINSCECLLRCCLLHGAPVEVSRAVYLTLRTSVAAAAPSSDSILSGWHALYARFLLSSSTAAAAAAVGGVSNAENDSAIGLQKEALRVLLLDAAEDGEVLQPPALLMSLEMLHRMSVCEGMMMTSSSSVDQLSHGTEAQEALWLCLLHETDGVTVARDVCCRVLRIRRVSLALMQQAFCYLVAIGMRLSGDVMQPFLRKRDTATTFAITCASPPAVTQQRYVLLLDMVIELLSMGSADHEAMVRVLGEPFKSQHFLPAGATSPFVSVWLVRHILSGLSFFHAQATSAASFRNAGGKDASCDELDAWKNCSRAAVQCLQSILLHISGDRRYPSTRLHHRQQQQCARHEVFCLLFQGVLDGLFCTFGATNERNGAVPKKMSDVMKVLVQFYVESDWHSPSVGLFIECLHAWGMYEVLQRVFLSVYKRDRHCNSSSLLSLSTCQLVVQSACEHNDPRTAAFAIAYMLHSLLAIKSSVHPTNIDGAEEVSQTGETAVVSSAVLSDYVINGQSLAAWKHLIEEQLIPRVDEVFCRTGIDTAQRWLNDLDGVGASVF